MPIYSPTGFLDITNATLRTSNVEAENLLMTGGNIYVTSELEADATVLNLENVTRKGNVSSNTIEITNATTGIVATGNVQASKFIGSGEYLTGIPPSAITGTLSQWSDGTNGDVYIAGGVGIANAHTLTSNTLQVGGNLYVRDTGSNVLTVDGNVVANYFEGDGSKLSGIVTDLQGVTDNGNTTTNVVQFSNVTTGLVTTANIEVGGDLKIDGLSAGKIPYVAADKFLKDSFITTTGDTTVITSNLDVTGNIFMRGDKFIVHSESKLINDAIVGIANNNTVSTTDKGIIMQNTAGNVAIIHHGTGDGFANQLTFGYTDDPLDTVTVTNDLTKELTVNVLGNVITQNNLSIGGLLKINTISAASSHSLEAVTNLGNVTSNTVQFSNAITSLVASSNIVATGNVSAGHDTNTTSFLGRAAVGYMGQDDQASFAHVDHNDPARYAIKQTAAGPTYINTPAAGHIRFTVNDGNAGAEKMRITSAGKVGIGATSPDATLHVAGNAYVSSNLTVSGNVEVGTANLFVDTTTGRVGIGTTSSQGQLHISSGTSGDCVLILEADTDNNYEEDNPRIEFWQDGGLAESAIRQSDNYLDIMNSVTTLSGIRFFTGDVTSGYTNAVERMRIDASGNAGIGTSNPENRLHLYGGQDLLRLQRSSNGNGVGIVFTDDKNADGSPPIQFGYLRYYHQDGQSFGTGNCIRLSSSESTETLALGGALHVGVDGKDAGDAGNHRKNFFIQSTYGGNTSQNYGWWMGAQDQGLSSTDNDFYFSVVRNGSIKECAAIIDQNNATMNFTGQHRTFVKDTPTKQLDTKEGLIVSADQNEFVKMSGGVAYGKDAITINESLPLVSLSTKSNDKKCFGVLSTTEDPETRKEVHGNIASTMRKEEGDTRVYVNSVGEGAIWVVNTNGTLESGDYITTSNVAGYGMKQDDDILHNYTVAKILMDCDFNPVTQPKRTIRKESRMIDYWIRYGDVKVTEEEYQTLPETKRKLVEDVHYRIDQMEVVKEDPEKDTFVYEQREEMVNVLDEHGEFQWEEIGETEKAYKIRYLDADGNITDEANAVHIAAFVGCTYHCG
uniref:Peptidase S74 domain-containing protein n=1 Tax=Micromonas commoda virus TaxID=3057169 RepID=A0AAU7YN52_9PHYC